MEFEEPTVRFREVTFYFHRYHPLIHPFRLLLADLRYVDAEIAITRAREADNAWIELRYTHVELSSRNVKPHDVSMVGHVHADAAHNCNRKKEDQKDCISGPVSDESHLAAPVLRYVFRRHRSSRSYFTPNEIRVIYNRGWNSCIRIVAKYFNVDKSERVSQI